MVTLTRGFHYDLKESNLSQNESKKHLSIQNYNVCIRRDLDNINLSWRFDFKLEPIFATAPAAQKIFLT